MKPYGKTYRSNKDHKSSECGICSEKVACVGKYPRSMAKVNIAKEINEITTEVIQWNG